MKKTKTQILTQPPYFCKIANEAIYQKYNFMQFSESPILKFTLVILK